MSGWEGGWGRSLTDPRLFSPPFPSLPSLRSFALSFVRSFVHSLAEIRSLRPSFLSFVRAFARSSVRSFGAHSLIHTRTPSLAHPLTAPPTTYPLTHSLVHSFIHSFTSWLVGWLVRSFTRSFVCALPPSFATSFVCDCAVHSLHCVRRSFRHPRPRRRSYRGPASCPSARLCPVVSPPIYLCCCGCLLCGRVCVHACAGGTGRCVAAVPTDTRTSARPHCNLRHGQPRSASSSSARGCFDVPGSPCPALDHWCWQSSRRCNAGQRH